MTREFKKNFKNSIIPLAMTSAIGAFVTGGLINMFDINKKTNKKDIAKGVIDLIFDAYEQEQTRLSDENAELHAQVFKLNTENAKLKNEKGRQRQRKK